jgi:hypothetical protein
MNIENEFIPYEQALALKELGFDESTYAWRQHGNGISGDVEGKRDYYNRKGDVYTALPLYQQAFRWFREKYDLQYNIIWNKFYEKTPYQYEVRQTWRNETLRPYGTSGMCKTYEEAELECVKKLIEIVKEKGL